MTHLNLTDIEPAARASIATVRCLAVRWAINPPATATEAVAARSTDGALVVARMSSRGVTIRRLARPADLVRVWSR